MVRKHPAADCENCPLYENGQFSPSVGPDTAHIAFVGEVPNARDSMTGEVFSGPSGKLLKIVMNYHNINPEEVFLTNAVLCRPKGQVATPPPEAVSACRSRLLSELTARPLREIVVLGNTASKSILGRDKVTQLRVGPGHRSDYFPSARVIATINPAACLRQADQFPNLITDIGKLNLHVRHFLPPEYIVSNGPDHAIELMDAISARQIAQGTRELVVDIEVAIEKDTAFDHPNHYGMLCVGLCYEHGKAVVLSEGDMAVREVQLRLGDLLRGSRVIAQNGKFDLAGLYPLLGDVELWFDTMLASYVRDERPGIHGLKYMGREYLGAPEWENEIQKYLGSTRNYGNIPRDILYKYNAYDVAVTWDLKDMFIEEFNADASGDMWRVHNMLVRASNQLKFLELNGWTVDKVHLVELDVMYKKILGELRAEMNDIIKRNLGKDYDKFGGINPNSPKQLKEAFADWGIHVDSTNEKTMELLKAKLDTMSEPEAEEASHFIEVLMKHRTEAKAHGTYVKGIRKRLYRGRVYSTYLLHGTTTGRLSSRNPNMQNIPRDPKLRKLFIASSDERILLQTDYSQAELRVLTYLAKDEYFRSIFNDPSRDIFDELTPLLYPWAVKSEMTKEAWKELRIRVKAYVYGLSYGREEYSIAQEFKIPVSQARSEMHKFFQVIPDVVKFRNEVKRKVLNGEHLVTPWGRHRRYQLITKENVKSVMNEALAFLPQSTASDMCLNALVEIRQETKGFAWIRNTVHDSIILECDKGDVDDVKEIVERRMLESAQSIVGDYVQFAVDSTTGRSWGDL